MIGLPANTRVWIVAGHTDMRTGFDGLASVAQSAPTSPTFLTTQQGYPAHLTDPSQFNPLTGSVSSLAVPNTSRSCPEISAISAR